MHESRGAITSGYDFRKAQEALHAHLKAKQAGAVQKCKPTFATPPRVINLMEALRRSIAEEKKSAAPRRAAAAAMAHKRALVS
jgi:non-homologous end joining protein Ku